MKIILTPPADTVQLLIHLLSWPLIFLAGVFRWNSPTILTSGIEGLQHRLSFLPLGWSEVMTAICFVAVDRLICQPREVLFQVVYILAILINAYCRQFYGHCVRPHRCLFRIADRFDLEAQRLLIPAGVERELVIGDDQRTALISVSPSITMTGTWVSPRFRAAGNLALPAMITRSLPAMISETNPNSFIDAAI